jgi:D-alanyl-D-alanine carboxypeptidase
MYNWLARHPHVARTGVVLDTGSGLSYRTQITPTDLVSIVRSAGGFSGDSDPKLAEAWLRSLAIAGTDGTLIRRFRGSTATGRVIGKTGTLSTVIALSGILDIDPQRPLAFSLVTNGDSPLSKNWVRRAHEQVIGEICKYLHKTAKRPFAQQAPVHPAPAAAPAAGPAAAPAANEPDIEDAHRDAALDAETAASK